MADTQDEREQAAPALEIAVSVTADENNNPLLGNEFRQIFPFPGKTKSKVWTYFGFHKLKEGPATKANLDMSQAVCRLCHKKYANKGNTTNFKQHIEALHPGEISSNSNTENIPRISQVSMDTFLNTTVAGRISRERQEQIDDALCKFISGKVVPISIVENTFFRSLISLLDPRYKAPSRFTVMRRLEKKKKEMDNKLRTDLEAAPYIAITHDGWTSLNTQSYFTTTIHFIDEQWVLKTAVLGTIQMKGSHTSDNIASELRATQEKWNLQRPTATTDNAMNEKKAFDILKWPRFSCYGHIINLVVKSSLNIPELSRLLGKARRLVTYFHQSSSINDILQEKQALIFGENQPNLVGHKLIIDVVTRWNSTLFMLQRLVEQFPVLMALANDPSLSKQASTTIKNCIFTFEEQTIMEALCNVLLPFERATRILCADQVPTMHKVLPIVTKFLKVIEVSEDDANVVKTVKQKMQHEINMRATSNKISLLGCILNPFTKNLDFAPDLREEAYGYLREEMLEESGGTSKNNGGEGEGAHMQQELSQDEGASGASSIPGHPVEQEDATPSQCKRFKSADTEAWLEDIVCLGQSTPDTEDAAEQETRRYLGMQIPVDDQILTVLQWWRQNEKFFPRISKIARHYLAIPGSSVSSERVFSLCGQIVNKKRCRISPKNVDLLVSLNKNLEAYW